MTWGITPSSDVTDYSTSNALRVLGSNDNFETISSAISFLEDNSISAEGGIYMGDRAGFTQGQFRRSRFNSDYEGMIIGDPAGTSTGVQDDNSASLTLMTERSGGELQISGRTPTIVQHVRRNPSTGGLAFSPFELYADGTSQGNSPDLLGRLAVRGNFGSPSELYLIGFITQNLDSSTWYNRHNFAVGQYGQSIINPDGEDIIELGQSDSTHGLVVVNDGASINGDSQFVDDLLVEGDADYRGNMNVDGAFTIDTDAIKIGQSGVGKGGYVRINDGDGNRAGILRGYAVDGVQLSLGIGGIEVHGNANITGNISTEGTISGDSLAGTYTGGSAYVCVYNNGTLYASESACP
ncbi:MAG: hypothetical protein R6U59_00760 [Eubacteriales bacterium]